MKKLLIVAVLALICCTFTQNVHAQAFDKGVKNLNLGLGLGYGLGVNASFDVGVSDIISVGAVGAFSSRNYGYLVNDYRVTYIGVGVRGAAHFGKFINDGLGIDNNKFDPYAGLVLGFRAVKYNDSYSSYYNGTAAGALFGLYVGGRYYFKDKFGVYLEGGFPYSSLGVTFKF